MNAVSRLVFQLDAQDNASGVFKNIAVAGSALASALIRAQDDVNKGLDKGVAMARARIAELEGKAKTLQTLRDTAPQKIQSLQGTRDSLKGQLAGDVARLVTAGERYAKSVRDVTRAEREASDAQLKFGRASSTAAAARDKLANADKGVQSAETALKNLMPDMIAKKRAITEATTRQTKATEDSGRAEVLLRQHELNAAEVTKKLADAKEQENIASKRNTEADEKLALQAVKTARILADETAGFERQKAAEIALDVATTNAQQALLNWSKAEAAVGNAMRDVDEHLTKQIVLEAKVQHAAEEVAKAEDNLRKARVADYRDADKLKQLEKELTEAKNNQKKATTELATATNAQDTAYTALVEKQRKLKEVEEARARAQANLRRLEADASKETKELVASQGRLIEKQHAYNEALKQYGQSSATTKAAKHALTQAEKEYTAQIDKRAGRERELNVVTKELKETERALSQAEGEQVRVNNMLVTAYSALNRAINASKDANKGASGEVKQSSTELQKMLNTLHQAAGAFSQIATHVNAAKTSSTTWTAVLINLGKSAIAAGAGVGMLVKAFAALAPVAGSALGKIIGSRQPMQIFAMAAQSAGTHILGMNVRLSGLQAGLYGAGQAMMGFASSARMHLTSVLNIAGDFEQKMVNIQAILGKHGEANAGDLRRTAIKSGQLSMYSPQEALRVETELIKAGLSVTQVTKDATGAVLNLATATGETLDVAQRAVISTQTIWARDTQSATEQVDILTRAANASAASVESLSDGLKNAGPIASGFGISLQDTSVILGALSNAGLRGGEGGTALRYFLLGLQPATNKGIEMMKDLGLETINLKNAQRELGKVGVKASRDQETALQQLYEKYTSSKNSFQQAIDDEKPIVGKFQQWLATNGIVQSEFVNKQTGQLRNAAEIVDLLWNGKNGKGGMKGLDEVTRNKQLSAIFGERGGSKGAIPLMIAQEQNEKLYDAQHGADGKVKLGVPKDELVTSRNVIENIASKMKDYGSAAEIAAKQLDTFKGSTHYTQASLTGLITTIGAPLMKPLAGFIKGIGTLINKITEFAEHLMETNPGLIEGIGKLLLFGTVALSAAGPLAMLSAIFPYILLGLRSMAIALAPVGISMLIMAGIVRGVIALFTDPQFGMSGALQGMMSSVGSVLPRIKEIFIAVFNGAIIPLGNAFAVIIKYVIIPAITGFFHALSGGGSMSAVQGFNNFVTGVIIPALLNLAQWLQSILPQAIRFLGWAFQNILIPSFGIVGGFIREFLIPILTGLWNFLASAIPTAVFIAAGAWSLLGPIIKLVADIILNAVLPSMVWLAQVIGVILVPVFNILGAVISFLHPIISFLAQGIMGILAPVLAGIAVLIMAVVIPAFVTMAVTFVAAFWPVLLVLAVVAAVVAAFRTAWENNFLGIRDFAKQVGDTIVAIWKGVAEFFSKIWSWLVDAWNNITGQAGQAGDAAGANYQQNLDERQKATEQDTDTHAGNLMSIFSSLEQPAGDAGFNIGFNFGQGLAESLDDAKVRVASRVRDIARMLSIAKIDQANMEDLGNKGALGRHAQNEFDNGRTTPLQKRIDQINKDLDVANTQLGEYSHGGEGVGMRNRGLEAGYRRSDPYVRPTMAGTSPTGSNADGIPYDQNTHQGGGPGSGNGGGKGGDKSKERTAAETAADIIKKVAESIKAGIEAMKKIMAFVVPAGLDAKVKLFAETVGRVVKRIADIAAPYIDKKGETPLLDAASKWAEVATKAMELITKGVEAFKALKDYANPAESAVNGFFNQIQKISALIVSMASKFKAEDLGVAQVFLDAAAKVVELITKGAEAFPKLDGFVEPAQDSVERFVNALKMIMLKLSTSLKDADLSMLDTSEMYAESMSKIIDTMQKGVDFVVKLSEWDGKTAGMEKQVESLTTLLTSVFISLDKVIVGHPEWVQQDGKRVKDVTTVGEALTKSLEGLDKALSIIDKLDVFRANPAGYATQILSVVNAVEHVLMQMSNLVTMHPEWTRNEGAQAKRVQLVGESMGKATEGLSKAIEFMERLDRSGTYIPGLAGRVGEVVNGIEQALTAFNTMLLKNPGWTDRNSKRAKEVEAVGEAFAKSLESLQKAVDFFEKLDVSKADVRNMQGKVEELVNAIAASMTTFNTMLLNNPGWTDKNGARAKEVQAAAEAFAKSYEALSKSVDFIERLQKTKANIPALQGKVVSLVNAIEAIMATFNNMLLKNPGWTDRGGKRAEEVAAYAENLGKTVATLTGVVDFLDKLNTTKKLDSSKVSEIVDVLMAVAEDFERKLADAGIKINQASVEAKAAEAAIASSIGSVIDTITKALDLTDKLKGYKAPANANGAVKALVAFLKDVAFEFNAALAELNVIDEEAVTAAGKIGGAVDGLSKGVDFLAKLADLKSVSKTRLKNFMDGMKETIKGLRELLSGVAADMLDTAKEFGEKMGPAFDLLVKGLDFFMKLQGDGEGKGLKPIDPDAIGEFTGKLSLLISKLKSDLLDKIAPEMYELAKEFGDKFGPSMELMSKSLDFFLKIQGDGDGKGLKPIDPDALGAVVGSIYILMKHWKNLITGDASMGLERSPEFISSVESVLTQLDRIVELSNRIQEANKDGGIDNLPHLVDNLMIALALIQSASVPDIEGSFKNMFSSTAAVFEEQAKNQNPTQLLYYWSGQNDKSLLWRMYTALEGKAGARETLRLSFTGLFQDLGTLFSQEAGALLKQWDTALQQMKLMITTALQDIKGMITGFTTGQISLSLTVNGLNVPGLATGGIALKPGLFQIAESEPEAVIPLSKLGQIAQGVGTTTSQKTNIFNIRSMNVNRTTDIAETDRRVRRLTNDLS